LFCDCPTILSTKPPTLTIERRLRPTQSELGQIDPAVLFEFHKGRTIRYEADPETTDLVELDEEPPHRLNEEAIDIALTITALFNASPMDEIHVMRKVVIDGSNTTGFQRKFQFSK
jgi:glutamyl-tRNA(Gln) amidotransferase subunit E